MRRKHEGMVTSRSYKKQAKERQMKMTAQKKKLGTMAKGCEITYKGIFVDEAVKIIAQTIGGKVKETHTRKQDGVAKHWMLTQENGRQWKFTGENTDGGYTTRITSEEVTFLETPTLQKITEALNQHGQQIGFRCTLKSDEMTAAACHVLSLLVEALGKR